MEGSSGETPKFEFPQVPQGHEEAPDRSLEADGSTASETASGKKQPSLTPANDPAAATPVPATIKPDDSLDDEVPVSNINAAKLPPAANLDRIEAEWITRSKKIVSLTKDDPYEQNRGLNRVRAEYMKKRFDKTIPTDDAVAA